MLGLLSPFIPHTCDELWERAGFAGAASASAWPVWDEAATVDDVIPVVVQVNGKLRSQLRVPADEAEDAIKAQALSDPKVLRFTGEKPPRKVIYVKGKLVNIVV